MLAMKFPPRNFIIVF